MTFIFLKLSKVKILSSTIVHTKNAALEWALYLQMRFQWNGEPSGVQSAWSKDLTSNIRLLEGIQQKESSCLESFKGKEKFEQRDEKGI